MTGVDRSPKDSAGESGIPWECDLRLGTQRISLWTVSSTRCFPMRRCTGLRNRNGQWERLLDYCGQVGDSWQSLVDKETLPGLVAAMERAWVRLKVTRADGEPLVFPESGRVCERAREHGMSVTYGLLFERPTPLEEGEDGLRNWLTMFGGAFFEGLTERQRDDFIGETVREARAELFRDGRWVIDYRRLRVVAKRTQTM